MMRKPLESGYGAISMTVDESVSDIEGEAHDDDDESSSCPITSTSQQKEQFPLDYQSQLSQPPLSEVFVYGSGDSTYSSITRLHRRKLYIVLAVALVLACYGYLALMERRILRHVKHDKKMTTLQHDHNKRPAGSGWLGEQWQKTRLFKQIVGSNTTPDGYEVVPLLRGSKPDRKTDNPSLILVVYGPNDDPWQQLMAKTVGEGIEQALGPFDDEDDDSSRLVNYRIQSIDDTDFDQILEADGVIIGASVENANIHHEVQQWINTQWDIGEDLSQKVGAAFITAGGISAGQESSLLSLIRSMLIFNMIIVGGDTWMAPFGASAITSEGRPYATTKQQQEGDDVQASSSSALIDPLFLDKARGLGKHVVQVVTRMNT